MDVMKSQALSRREREILSLISHEFTAKEIANKLFISAHTVDSHRKNLQIKMNARNTAGLVRRGFELGVLAIPRLDETSQNRS